MIEFPPNVDPRRAREFIDVYVMQSRTPVRRIDVTPDPLARHADDYIHDRITIDRLEVECDLDLCPHLVIRRARAGMYPMATVYEAAVWRMVTAGHMPLGAAPTGPIALLGEVIPYP